MTSSDSHKDTLILSGAYESKISTIIYSLKTNRFSCIQLVSGLFDPVTYTIYYIYDIIYLFQIQREGRNSLSKSESSPTVKTL